ncbi:MAG: 5-methyltetrahydropteroyltriglutamate--homocysteine S-methyltransferase [Bacteroidetes bacterium]|jgi:5-methyltetrahydropteroyltriglutamate--homocysteine methyltransferase|nr:5-methyltetrahydropteroyltriglutamate--homocysteine S-methyltransferase [Bacteroidota bacterium]
MVQSSVLGFPRIGVQRELKHVLEDYWSGDASESDLHSVGRRLRERHWEKQADAGIDFIPSGDFSFYDHVLDAACMVGAVPDRFGWNGEEVDFDTYFAMARGLQEKDLDRGADDGGAAALEMTKWFDTNYHYLVPELQPDQEFNLASTRVIDAYEEARDAGIQTRPVLLGPVSFLLLSKLEDPTGDAHVLDLLDDLLPVYETVLRRLRAAGAEAVQIDEPCLVLDLEDAARPAYRSAMQRLQSAAEGLDLHLTTYFDGVQHHADLVLNLPVDVLHLDVVQAPEQLEALLPRVPDDLTLSLGLVNGRNVWRADLDQRLETAQTAIDALGRERVIVGTSCSLLHVPVDLETEEHLPETVTSWLAFATRKLNEVAALASAASGNTEAAAPAFRASRKARASREASEVVNDPEVKKRAASIAPEHLRRDSPHTSRRTVQNEHLDLPLLPTTTIGSFPQTEEIRDARRRLKEGDISEDTYESFLEREIAQTIEAQEDIGLDVLVHGEPERSDMVEYFGQQLDGFLFTENGWVQSYGSRCVRPPIIYGDVKRTDAMTVRWSSYAQSLTDRPVKGMLTGPVTMLQWSFVRDDQPRAETCRQIALALRDEVADLEDAGISVIQIDEPALREGLPLRESKWDAYLTWAVEAFRLASSGVTDRTQIHTHMCYADFEDIIEAIADMDADVISIESSRSRMELLDTFEAFDYPNQIGPGVYDIHSPRVPTTDEMADLLNRALTVLNPGQLWVNPDCGLKTRRWVEVKPALRNMVNAARRVRESLSVRE